MEEFYLKIHDSPMGDVVAVCDVDLMGKSFREGKLHIEVNEDFYLGQRVGIDAAINAIGNCFTANLVGKKIVTAAIDAGIIDEEMVLYIEGVPHAQVVYIE